MKLLKTTAIHRLQEHTFQPMRTIPEEELSGKDETTKQSGVKWVEFRSKKHKELLKSKQLKLKELELS